MASDVLKPCWGSDTEIGGFRFRPTELRTGMAPLSLSPRLIGYAEAQTGTEC